MYFNLFSILNILYKAPDWVFYSWKDKTLLSLLLEYRILVLVLEVFIKSWIIRNR